LRDTQHAGPWLQKEAWELILRVPVVAAMAVIAAEQALKRMWHTLQQGRGER
jgi:hypothetical protein